MHLQKPLRREPGLESRNFAAQARFLFSHRLALGSICAMAAHMCDRAPIWELREWSMLRHCAALHTLKGIPDRDAHRSALAKINALETPKPPRYSMSTSPVFVCCGSMSCASEVLTTPHVCWQRGVACQCEKDPHHKHDGQSNGCVSRVEQGSY